MSDQTGEDAGMDGPAGPRGEPAADEARSTEPLEAAARSARGRDARDPAGTRPKVSAAALAPADPTVTGPGAGALGQTFRVPAPDAPPSRPPSAPADADAAASTRESPHAPRFQFILGALLALGLSAVAITAYALGSGRDRAPLRWSAWHPASSGTGAAVEIANHVAVGYRLAGAGQLLAVQGGPLVLAGVPLTILVKADPSAGGDSILSGSAVLYRMCGLGPSCSIGGKPSVARLMLVRREALELALYSFRYAGVDQVVVFLPPVVRMTPVPGKPKQLKATPDTSSAVFFRSKDLGAELDRPLGETLTAQPPSLTTIDRAPDTARANRLTSTSAYRFNFVQAGQDATVYIVMTPSTFGR